MVDVGKFSDRLSSARRRAEALWQSSPGIVADELVVAWEELLVAEEELRQQNDELAAAAMDIERERRRFVDLFESAPDPYVITDLKGSIRQANRAAVDMLGFDMRRTLGEKPGVPGKPAVAGKPLVLFVTPADKRRFRSLLTTLPQLRRALNWDIVMQPRQGAAWPASVAAVMTEEEIRWTFRDISQRRQVEDERKAWTEELERRVVRRTEDLEARTHDLAEALVREQELRRRAEEADRAKDAFLATVSHELRTPLTSLLGWVYLLSRGEGQRMEPRAMAAIERATRAQVKLVDDILDASRMMAGTLTLDPRPCDLAEIVMGAAEALRPQAEQKGLELACRGCDEPLPLLADPDRLQQVVWNLLSNAVKFTPRGGRVETVLERGAERAKVVVTDTGIGIDPDFLPHVFERFRQADSSTTRAHGGMGLGLAIARHLAEAHGGTLEAQSQGRGSGSTFRLVVPVVPPREAPAPEAAATGRTAGEALRVLVVDDDDDTRAMLVAALAAAGFEPRAAATVDEALALVAAAAPHVVLSDIGMPEKDGYALVRSLRELPLSASVPVIALSGYSGPEARRHAQEAGFQDLLVKPVLPDELQRALRAAVRLDAQEAR